MAQLTTQKIKEEGLNPTYSNADVAGDTFSNSGSELVHVKNGGTAAVTVTVPTQDTATSDPVWGKLTKADISVSVPAGDEAFIGVIPKRAFNNSTGKVNINYSAVTSVSVAVLKIK
jgi:hypothetical protein